MHEETSAAMDEVRHLRWRLDQVERDRDDYRALWEEERAEHRRTKERMAQAMDEAYNNGYQSGRIQGFEAGQQSGLIQGYEAGYRDGREPVLRVLRWAEDFISNGLEMGYIAPVEPGSLEERTVKRIQDAVHGTR